MLRNIAFPRFMKNLLRVLALLLITLPGGAFAGDFKSAVINDTNSLPNLHVSNDQFLVIRNFTQDMDTNPRGVVTVAPIPAGPMIKVLVAAVVDPTVPPPEVINNIVIAGPANVSATCGAGATCFLTYRKESN
jgi:hypothetical protein